MKILSRIIKALNQSFRLIFVAIGNEFKAVVRFTKKLMHLLSDSVKLLHKLIAAIIQLAINLTSTAFILFIPIIFFFDPLNWARHLEGAVGDQAIFIIRISLGVFFSLVAFFLVKELYNTWKDIDDNKEEGKQRIHHDFIGFISKLLAWIVIWALLLYFIVFRYQFVSMELYFQHLPSWVQELLINLYPKQSA